MKPFITVWAFLLLASWSSAQNSLSGVILDDQGEPLPYATVLIQETEKGTTTDADGFFRFPNLDKGFYKLFISYIGFDSYEHEIYVDGPTSIETSLKKEAFTLETLELLSTWADAKTPVTFTNLGKETLQKSNLGQDVPYLLRWTPSAVVNSDGGTGIGYTGIRIRGSDPSRINVTINGIPLNDAESQGVFWVDLPDFVSSTNAIQIQRGAGTSTNGAGAFGATINLKTGERQTKPYAELNNSFGSFNSWKHNIQLGSGLLGGKFSLDGRFSRITSDGFIDRATARLHSFYASGTYWGDRSSLQFNVFSGHEVTYQAWNGVPAQYINDDQLRTTNTAGAEKAGEPHDNEVDDYTQTHYQLLYKKQLTDHTRLNLAAHYTRGKGFFEQYKGEEELFENGFPQLPDTLSADLIRRRWLDNHYYGLTYSLHYEPAGGRLNVTLGGAVNTYRGRHFGEIIWTDFHGNVDNPPLYYDNDAEKGDANIFLKAEYQLTNKLNVYGDLQFRRVDYEFLGFDTDASNITQQAALNFFNPKLGLYYELKRGSGLYASFSVAQREPNRDDYTESSPQSRPRSEKLYDTELGYRLQRGANRLGANLYWMNYKDQLVPTGRLNDVGGVTRVNVDDSYRIGLELDGNVELSEGLNFGGTMTFSQNKIKNFTEYIDNWVTGVQAEVIHEDTDLALSPNVIFGAELSYDVFAPLAIANRQSLEISLMGKYVGKQYIDNTSNENTTLDPYFFSDLRLRYKLKEISVFKEVAATLLVRNLFDARYETGAWTYRYDSANYDARAFDPYTRLEGGDRYNQTGFFPQAGINFLLGLSLKF